MVEANEKAFMPLFPIVGWVLNANIFFYKNLAKTLIFYNFNFILKFFDFLFVCKLH